MISISKLFRWAGNRWRYSRFIEWRETLEIRQGQADPAVEFCFFQLFSLLSICLEHGKIIKGILGLLKEKRG
jgi:hypothetical protein